MTRKAIKNHRKMPKYTGAPWQMNGELKEAIKIFKN